MTERELWHARLLHERDTKNLTDMHVRILLFTKEAIEAGNDQLSHAAIAKALKVGVGTVGKTFKRARRLGLLDWETQFRNWHGVRRMTMNQYRVVPPKPEATQQNRASISYGQYLKTSEWRDKRRAALTRALYRCQLCNANGNAEGVVLQVHHRSYDTFGKEFPSDLIVLCKPCHARHHQIYARRA